MSPFDAHVSAYMNPPTHTVGPDTHLPEVDRVLEAAGISGLPVVNRRMRPLGVVTRTDLLRAGAVTAVTGTTHGKLIVPDRRVGDVMRGEPLCVTDQARLADAVRIMREQHVHRVLVTKDDRLVGIVTTWDVMRALVDARATTPIGKLMTSPVVVISPSAPTASALAKLGDAHVRGLVIVESGWPIGVFTQREALLAERWPARSTVERWLDPAVLTLPPNFPTYRAAAQAIATRARTIAVMDLEGVCGIVTGTNFLYAAPTTARAAQRDPRRSSRPPVIKKPLDARERPTAPAMPQARRKSSQRPG